MEWRTLRLELAPTGEFPNGSVARCYFVRLPIDEAGRVDTDKLENSSRRATVRRYWSSEPDQWGYALPADGRIMLKLGDQMRTLTFEDQVRLGALAHVGGDDGTFSFVIAGITPPF